MGDKPDLDLLSNLPQSIIETILTCLPIADAVRTTCLSRKWRYKWTTLTDLVFDDRCVTQSGDQIVDERSLVNFITRLLFLHRGPIHKFQVCTSILQSCPDVDQWILFLSRNGVKEVVLELGEDGEWFRVPWCLFRCERLRHLDLYRCELEPPPTFNGFPCLKSLNLHQVLIAPEAIEFLISSCPLLESLSLAYFDSLALNICAPNLKHLCLEGEFNDICLENTPLLVDLSVTLYMTDENGENYGDGSNCTFIKVLGGIPHLERLSGHIYFTKYLSIGKDPGVLPITYNHLKTIELYQVSFEDMKEILVVLRLITNSPNLKELQLSGSSLTSTESPDLDFWDEEGLSDFTFHKLKVVKMTDISGLPHEMEFIKFLLRKSPVLEVISIMPCVFVTMEARLIIVTKLLSFARSSPKAGIVFLQD